MSEILTISSEINQELNQVLEEYNKACEKHSEFATSILEANTILVEEVGEVSKAILDSILDFGSMEGDKEQLKTEIAQVAAVCLRMLKMINENE